MHFVCIKIIVNNKVLLFVCLFCYGGGRIGECRMASETSQTIHKL